MAQHDFQEPGRTRPGLWGPGVPRRWWTVPPPSRTLSGTALALLAVALFVITQQSLAPATGMPSIRHIDKVLHLLAYASVAGLAVVAFGGRVLAALVFGVIWGVSVEIAQGTLTTGRQMSGADVVANTVGAFIGAWLAAHILRRLLLRRLLGKAT